MEARLILLLFPGRTFLFILTRGFYPLMMLLLLHSQWLRIELSFSAVRLLLIDLPQINYFRDQPVMLMGIDVAIIETTISHVWKIAKNIRQPMKMSPINFIVSISRTAQQQCANTLSSFEAIKWWFYIKIWYSNIY